MIWTYNTQILPGGIGVWCTEERGVFVGRSNGVPILRIDSLTDAHAQRTNFLNYPYNMNLSTNNFRVVIFCDYKSSCPLSDTCVISMESDTNAHVGDCSEYPIKLCCNATLFIITPRFLERKVFISMGETYHAALEVSNPNPFRDNITLRLQGTYPAGLAKFLASATGTVSPDGREMNISLLARERKILYVEMISTGISDYTLGVLAFLPEDPSLNVTDQIDVTIGFQAAFPGMEGASILAVLLISGIIFWKKRAGKARNF